MSLLKSRHALADSAMHGIEMPGANHLELVDGLLVTSVQPFRGKEAAVENALLAVEGASLRVAGPADWLVVHAEPLPEIDGASALVVDQSHGRSLFRLKGPDAVRILMKGVAIDLSGGAMAIGASANLALGHISVNLARTGETSFEILVMRSYADSLHHDLKVAGQEFGLSFGVVER